MKERIFDLIKWTLLIILATSLFHTISANEGPKANCDDKRFIIVGAGKGIAYKMDQCTGQTWWIAGRKEIPVKDPVNLLRDDKDPNDPLGILDTSDRFKFVEEPNQTSTGKAGVVENE